MPRNRSERGPTPPPGASERVLKFMRLEALGPMYEFIKLSLEGGLAKEYFAIGWAGRCRYRAALRENAGLPKRQDGIGRC